MIFDGYIKGSSDIGFGVPIYLKEDSHYMHVVDSRYRIMKFSKVNLKSYSIIKSSRFGNKKFCYEDLCVIIFNYNTKEIIEVADNFVIDVHEYIKLIGINNKAILNEINHIEDRVYNARFNAEKLNYSTTLMKALAHPLRLKIIEYIHNEGIVNVNNICQTLKIEQSVTSQHLRLLRLAGVANAEKKDKHVYYNLNLKILEKASIAVNNFILNKSESEGSYGIKAKGKLDDIGE